MSFPKNGRVVIIDDKIEEALPLAKALSKRGISVLIYSGRASEFPEKPINAIRLLFLDLNLEGMDFEQDPENQAKMLKPVVEKIISSDNGPYILFGWTKTPECLEILNNNLEQKPVLCLDMGKNDCMVDGVLELSKIEEKITNRMQNIGHYQTIFSWESIVNDASATTINRFFNGNRKPPEVESILYYLAEANLGKHVNSVDKNLKIKAALQCFNTLLTDAIDYNLNNIDFSILGDINESSSIIPDIHDLKSHMNTMLLLDHRFNNEPYPGNVYIEFDSKQKEQTTQFINDRIKLEKIRNIVSRDIQSDIKGNDRNEIIEKRCKKMEGEIKDSKNVVFVEITPVCDHAQCTFKNRRLISGFLIGCSLYKELEKTGDDKAYYISPHFYLDDYGGCYQLILDCRGIRALEKGVLENIQPLFRINNEFLFDIQHKTSFHFGRPGLINL